MKVWWLGIVGDKLYCLLFARGLTSPGKIPSLRRVSIRYISHDYKEMHITSNMGNIVPFLTSPEEDTVIGDGRH